MPGITGLPSPVGVATILWLAPVPGLAQATKPMGVVTLLYLATKPVLTQATKPKYGQYYEHNGIFYLHLLCKNTGILITILYF